MVEGIRDIQCNKCRHIENIYINVENRDPNDYTRKDTFLCKNCDQLSTIDTVNQKVECKNCRSTNINKYFSDNQVKCPKCGNKAFGVNIFD